MAAKGFTLVPHSSGPFRVLAQACGPWRVAVLQRLAGAPHVLQWLAGPGVFDNRGMANQTAATRGRGRPLGEVHAALLQAVRELATPEQGPTLREMAHRACVGTAAATSTVKNMVRNGFLVIERTRRVPYINKPVAEYGIPPERIPKAKKGAGGALLAAALSGWGVPCASDDGGNDAA